jgi:hypothetical protein
MTGMVHSADGMKRERERLSIVDAPITAKLPARFSPHWSAHMMTA